MATDSVLLVEGQDDQHVITHLLVQHQLAGRFEIKVKDGIDNLIATLSVELRASELKRIGLVVGSSNKMANPS